MLVLVVGGWARPAAAQTCSFQVSNISFGSVSPVQGAATVASTGTLTITCSNLGLLGLLPLTITLCPNLDAGTGGSTAASRLLANGSATEPYQLYQDAAHTQPWGSATFLNFNSVPTINVTSDTSGAIHATRTVYALLTNQASTTAGTYSSTFAGEAFYWGLNILSCAGVTVGTLVTPPAFTVSTTIINDCLLSTGALNFGTAGLLTAGVAAQSSINVTCTAQAPYSVALGPGGAGAGPTTRQMAGSSGAIQYGLYKDAAHTLPWGDTAAGASTLASGTGSGASQTLTVYGYVPAQTTPAPGNYSDSVVVTLSF